MNLPHEIATGVEPAVRSLKGARNAGLRTPARLALGLLALAGGALWLVVRLDRQAALDRSLVDALRRGHYTEARALLDRGADPNTRMSVQPFGRWQALADVWQRVRGQQWVREETDPPLLLCRPRIERSRMAAVLPERQERDRAVTLEALILHGADINSLTSSHLTLLQTAAQQNDETLLKALLNHNVSLAPAHDTPPAINLASAQSVALLITHGADPEQVFLPAASPVIGFTYNENVVTPLTNALRTRDRTALKILLDCGVDPHTYHGERYGPPGSPVSGGFGSVELLEFCMTDSELLKLFFVRYGDLNRRNARGITLLGEASRCQFLSERRKEAVVRLLLSRGAR